MQDMAFQALEAFKVQHNGKCFNLSHCFRVIKDEEVQGAICRPQVAWGEASRGGEKQAKMLEIEARKQANMLEIEATNAKTKAKEVALASMMTGVEIMKVDLNTMSPRKRSWFEKMQADMLKFNDE
ncbi:hypothetical protein VPH35_037068 [Triticum aestivum]